MFSRNFAESGVFLMKKIERDFNPDGKVEEYPVVICDKCGKEVDEYYLFFGDDFCEDCLLSEFEKVVL